MYVKYSLLFAVLIFLISCSTDDITGDDLIEGEWVVTAGYKDGKPEGESYCSPSVDPGLEFKDEETVYSKGYESDFSYELEKDNEGVIINLQRIDGSMHRTFFIEKISEDEFGLVGRLFFEGQNCYFERQ
ncbi:hypothetical protein [Oceanobacillus sp. J11TS1]|uniref:hypothetical protein n=1 Tax=Oceanobacillus sp. J11TS1 TaxID=2807191 RepID=UPI001BB34289|nr:hypothetical protein [Oceanobacillus sp. J11TS1]